MKHKVLFDGNGSSLIRVIGVGHYVPVAEAEALKAECEALAAQAQALKTAAKFILDAKKPETKRKAYAALADAVGKTPQQHIAESLANTAEKFYCMGWEHSLSTKSDDGDHYACGKRLAKSFADSIRQGEVE